MNDVAKVAAGSEPEQISFYGPDGYLVKFTAMCNAIKEAARKIRENEERRTAAYQRGYQDGLAVRAHILENGE